MKVWKAVDKKGRVIHSVLYAMVGAAEAREVARRQLSEPGHEKILAQWKEGGSRIVLKEVA